MGPVEKAVRGRFHAPVTLYTLGQKKPFILSAIDPEGIVLLLGSGKWHTRLTWACHESVIPFFRSHPGWIPAGGKFSVDGESGTLDQHLKHYLKRDVARWLARVLELAGVVEVGPTRQLSVRIETSYR